ncbi:MAG: hypothetical protein KJ709_02080 [Nanoarchaeota archaeon]|nr:hypothetical protein [Nanoarchaeota archaeon]
MARALRVIGIISLLVLVVAAVGFSLSSERVYQAFTIMEKSVCDKDGMCESGEVNCEDCPANIAGRKAFTLPEKGTDIDRFLFAAIGVSIIVALEIIVLAKRK